MARINTMVSVSVSLFVFFAFASLAAAQETSTPASPVPHTVVRGERMRAPYTLSGQRHVGLLVEHGNMSIRDFRALHPDNPLGVRLITRQCAIPIHERRITVEGRRSLLPCPPEANRRVHIWALRPGRTVYLPRSDTTAPATAPPQPRPTRVRQPTPRVTEPVAPTVVAQVQPQPTAPPASPQPDPRVAELEARVTAQSRELTALQDQLREGTRRAGVNARVLELNSLLREEQEKIRQMTGAALRTARRIHDLEGDLRRANTNRQRMEREARQREKQLQRATDGSWPWWITIAILGVLLALTPILAIVIMDWRRLTQDKKKPHRPHPSRVELATAWLALNARMHQLERVLRGLPGYDPDAPTSDNIDRLTALRMLVSTITQDPGYDEKKSLPENLSEMIKKRVVTWENTPSTTNRREADTLRAQVDAARQKIQTALGTDPDTEPTLPDLLDALITDQNIAGRRLVEEVFGKPDNGETVKERLIAIRLEKIRLQTANNELVEESRSNAAILREHSDELIAENQRLQDLLAETQVEREEENGHAHAWEARWDALRESIIKENPGVTRGFLEDMVRDLQEELNLLRNNAEFRVARPASEQKGPRALATGAPPAGGLADLSATGEHVLAAVTAAHHSNNPPPPALEEDADSEGTRKVDTDKLRQMAEDSAAASDSLPPLEVEDTQPRVSMVDMTPEEVAAAGIDPQQRRTRDTPRGKSRLPKKTDPNFPSPIPPPPNASTAVVEVERRGSKHTACGLGKPPPPPRAVVGNPNAPRFPKTEVPAAVEGSGLFHLAPTPNPPVISTLAEEAEDMTAEAESLTGKMMRQSLVAGGVGMDSQAPPPDPAEANRSSIFEDEDGDDSDSSDPTVVAPRPVQPDDTGDSPPPKGQLH